MTPRRSRLCMAPPQAPATARPAAIPPTGQGDGPFLPEIARSLQHGNQNLPQTPPPRPTPPSQLAPAPTPARDSPLAKGASVAHRPTRRPTGAGMSFPSTGSSAPAAARPSVARRGARSVTPRRHRAPAETLPPHARALPRACYVPLPPRTTRRIHCWWSRSRHLARSRLITYPPTMIEVEFPKHM